MYKPIILILYGCEIYSLTLREEHRLRAFKNKVLRRIFEPKEDEVMGGWKELRNKELSDLFSSPSIFRIMNLRRMRWAGHVVVRKIRVPMIFHNEKHVYWH
jgi:hypothetical protein